MSLVLYGHPFSSYTQTVLIALDENATAFEFRCIGPETPQHTAEWLRRWPLGAPVWSHDGILCTGETYKSVVKVNEAAFKALVRAAVALNQAGKAKKPKRARS